MKKNIAVVGCGQLGRRHIQGLGHSKFDLNVHVYDVATTSLETCETFIQEIAEDIGNLSVTFHSNLATLGKAVTCFDLTIIASTAHDRPAQMTAVLASVSSKNWLLEKPLTQSVAELDELEKILAGQNVWINHFRRFIPWQKELKAEHFAAHQVDVTIAAPELGIGCNISHLVDLVNYWSDEIPTNVDASGLAASWHDAKRHGFKEVDGTMKMIFSRGSTLTIVSESQMGTQKIAGTLKGRNSNNAIEFSIDEEQGTAVVGGADTISGQMLFQSQLTGAIFDQLEATGGTDLTSFDLAAKCYRPVIAALLSHWQSTTGGQTDASVPLT